MSEIKLVAQQRQYDVIEGPIVETTVFVGGSETRRVRVTRVIVTVVPGDQVVDLYGRVVKGDNTFNQNHEQLVRVYDTALEDKYLEAVMAEVAG